MAPKAETLVLPVGVIGPVDLGRLIRELEVLDEQLLQAGLRHQAPHQVPTTSRLLRLTLEQNKLNALEETERRRLHDYLMLIKVKAPTVHLSFSSDPAPAALEKLVTWFRREIHPMTLITVGMQPNLGAGCVLRTTNRYFDFSLRERFKQSRPLLVKELQEVRK